MLGDVNHRVELWSSYVHRLLTDCYLRLKLGLMNIVKDWQVLFIIHVVRSRVKNERSLLLHLRLFEYAK